MIGALGLSEVPGTRQEGSVELDAGGVVLEPWSAYACNAPDREGEVFQVTTR